MKKKRKPPPTPHRPTYRRYDVSALARDRGLDIPILLSQKVWQTCVQEPADSDTWEMVAELDNLLVQLAEVMNGDKEADMGVEYQLSKATVESLPPEYTALPAKLKAVCEETVSNYMVVTVYLATEAQAPVFITDVYQDDSGCLTLLTLGRCGAVMVPKGA